jgi:hypothetical protein
MGKSEQIMCTRVVGSSSQLEHIVYTLGILFIAELMNGAWIDDKL